MHLDPDACANGIHAFVRLSLHGNGSLGDIKVCGEPCPYRVDERTNLWPLAYHRGIDVADVIPGIANLLYYRAQHDRRVGSAPTGIGIWEMGADVAQGRSPKQGIDHGMYQHIGIRMPDQLRATMDRNAAQFLGNVSIKRLICRKPVRIISEANPHHCPRNENIDPEMASPGKGDGDVSQS